MTDDAVDPEATAASDVDLVVVSYNSADHLRALWATKTWAPGVSVYVVDNSSADDSADVAKQFAVEVAVIPNRGLSIANNVGASFGTAPYVVFCNPDLDIDQDAVDALVAHLRRESCLVTGRLVNPDGSPQPNARRFPTVRRQLASRGLGRALYRDDYLWGPTDGTARTDWFVGACLGVRRRDLIRLGGWPNQYFLYFEDVALCREAWRQQLPVYIDNDITIGHAWSRGSRTISRSAARHARSALRFYAENPRLIWPSARAGLVEPVMSAARRERVTRSVSRSFRQP